MITSINAHEFINRLQPIEMNTQLLVEQLLPEEANVIVESNAVDTFLRGIFMQSEIDNRNGRKYPFTEIKNAVTALAEQIRMGAAVMGELDHPNTLQINLDRVSHAITEVRMDGNNAVGKLKLLGTPMGNIAKEIVRAGVRLGISSRGAGSVMEGKVSGFTIVTCDLVATPSAPGAMLNISESVLNQTGRKVITLAEAMKEDKAAQKYFEKEIKKFILETLKRK